MHEFSAVKYMIDLLLERLSQEEIEEVVEVTIAVGEFRFLNLDQLRFAYEILSKGTILEGSKLRIEVIEGVIRCDGCGYIGRAGFFEEVHDLVPSMKCPECGKMGEVVRGNEFILRAVRVRCRDSR
jgi:hydrogenase nickel incorporation protein HypA/HybF